MKYNYLKKKQKRKKLPFFSFLIVIFILYKLFIFLDNSSIKLNDEEYVNILLSNTFKNDKLFLIKSIAKKIYNNPTIILRTGKVDEINIPVAKVEKVEKENKPLIYIYNTHQGEEYAKNTFINPSVMIGNYILKDVLEENNYPTLVETRSIKEILNNNNWSYSSSYKASRLLLEDSKKNNNTLKYYIDVHRDSLEKERTTIEIENKSYAKLLFIVGLENKTYQSNLDFTNQINQQLEKKYPNLSKGIYKKSGPGVNGIYNQDFSPYSILIEVGGYENTTTEVLNSMLAFAECYMEVISNYENR